MFIAYSQIGYSSVTNSHSLLTEKPNIFDISYLANKYGSDVLLILTSVVNSVESIIMKSKLLYVLKMEHTAYR